VHVREVAGEVRETHLFLLQLFEPALQLAVEQLRLAAYVLQLRVELLNLPVQVLAAFFDLDRLAVLRQHEQQDDRAETAANAVEEREAEHLDGATAQLHGQSFDGMSSVPCVKRESAQKRCAAGRSPFIGISTTSTGTFSGSSPIASSNRRARLFALMYLRKPTDLPMVGRPSVMRRTWSGSGLIDFTAANALMRLVPSSGTRLLSASMLRERTIGSLASCHLPADAATTGSALLLKP